MSLRPLQVGKFLLIAGLLVVLVQGLLQVPELQDCLFPGKYYQSELRVAEVRCLEIEEDLTLLRGRVQALEGLLAQKTRDRKVSATTMILSPWSEGVRSLSPEFVWKVDLFLAQRTRVKVVRSLRYVDFLLENLESMQTAFCQNGAASLHLNRTGGNLFQEIRARCQISSVEIKGLSKKLNSLEVRGKNL